MNTRSRPAISRAGSLVVSILLGISSFAAAGSNTWTGGYPSVVAPATRPSVTDPFDPSAPATTVVTTDPLNPSVVYAALNFDLYKSADGGRSWAWLASLSDNPSDHVLSVFVSPTSPSTLFVGLESGLLRSVDGGTTWALALQQSITTLAAQPSDPSVLFAGSATGTVSRGANDGAAWTKAGQVSASITFAIASLLFGDRDDTKLYAAGGYDLLEALYYPYGIDSTLTLTKSADQGATFTDLGGAFPPGDHLYVTDLVAGSSPGELFAAMGRANPDQRLAHSADGGATWDQTYLRGFPGYATINRLVVDPVPGTLYAATRHGIYRTTDDGRTWLPFGQSVRDLHVTSLVLGGRTLHAGTAYGEFDLDLREGAVDVSAGPAGTRLLLWNRDRLAVRTLQPSGDPTQTAPEGPFGGWTAVAIADGTDRKSRVLWVNGDGRTGLEIVGVGGGEDALRYPAEGGVLSPMSAVDISVGANSITHLLWTNVLGAARISSLDSSGRRADGPDYGPYRNWSAIAIADGPGETWVLWRAADGRMSLSVHRELAMEAVLRFAASPGWAAEDLTVGADGRPRVLRVSPDGRAEISTVDLQARLANSQVLANPGFEPRRIAAGPDGLTRLLWGSEDGSDSLTFLNADNTAHAEPPEAPPPTPSSDLGGSWTGTLTLSGPCADTALGRRCPSSQPVDVTFSQSESTLTGYLTTGCEGTLAVRGTAHPGGLSLDLSVANGGTIALSGSADSQAIDAGSLDLCDPWGYESTVWLQLSRRLR